MHKIIFLLLVFLGGSLNYEICAQTKFEEQESKVSLWVSDTYQPIETQGKVKTKTIKYSSWGYSIEIDLSKKKIFPGSRLKIFNADKILTFDGVVTSVESPLSLKGRMLGENGIEFLGSFVVSNTPEGWLELKPNKAENIAISASAVDYILASDFGNQVIVNLTEKIIVIDGKSSNCDFSCISAPMYEVKPQAVLDVDIRAVLDSISNNVTVFYEGRTFNGSVTTEAIDLNPVTYLRGTGILTYDDGKTVSIKRSAGNYVMTISGDPQINSGNETCYTVPIFLMSEDNLWSEKEFIQRAVAYQEQQEEAHSMSELVSSSQAKALEDSKVSKSSSGSSSGCSTFEEILVICLIFLGVILYILHLIHARDCPNCGKTHAMVDVNKVNLGKAYVKKERQPDGTYAEIHCNRYKIIRRCRYCGYEDCKLTNEKGRPF